MKLLRRRNNISNVINIKSIRQISIFALLILLIFFLFLMRNTPTINSKYIRSHQEPQQVLYTIPQNPVLSEKAEFVRNMMKHAWSGFREYALGKDYLSPVTKGGANMMSQSIDLTLHDSLSTLYIMNLKEEFIDARNLLTPYIDRHYSHDAFMSFFETTIRSIGGLVSAFDLSGDRVFLKHAVAIADKLLPAFDTGTGMPQSFVNFKTGAVHSYGPRSSIAEIASNILEFTRLSQVTGDPKYEKKARKVLDHLASVSGKFPDPGLFPLFMDLEGHINMHEREYSLGAMADSYYEYLLKAAIMLKDKQSLDLWYKAYPALLKNLYKESGGNYYFSQDSKLQHLACFSGGMFALNIISGYSTNIAHDREIAENVTHSCYLMYKNSKLGLSPEIVNMNNNRAVDNGMDLPYAEYKQRPEVLESIWYMWRLTKDEKYRNWAWEIASSIEKVRCYINV